MLHRCASPGRRGAAAAPSAGFTLAAEPTVLNDPVTATANHDFPHIHPVGNNLLAVRFSLDGGGVHTLVGITWDSGGANPQAMTLAGTPPNQGGTLAYCYYLVNPITTGEALIRCALSGSTAEVGASAASWNGLDTGTPLDVTPTSAVSTTHAVVGSITPVTDGALVLSQCATRGDAGDELIKSFAPMTVEYTQIGAGGTHNTGSREIKATAGLVDVGFEEDTGSTLARMALMIVAFRPAV